MDKAITGGADSTPPTTSVNTSNLAISRFMVGSIVLPYTQRNVEVQSNV